MQKKIIFKLLLTFLVVGMIFTLKSCLPDDDPFLENAKKNLEQVLGQIDQDKLDAELAVIDDSLAAWDLTGDVRIESQGGVRYIIHSEGTKDKPELNSLITFNYSGKLMQNGEEFDAGEELQGYLYQFITGFQTTLPNIKQGSEITMYIPSVLGYGNQDVKDNVGATIVPANSNLIFEVALVEVD